MSFLFAKYAGSCIMDKVVIEVTCRILMWKISFGSFKGRWRLRYNTPRISGGSTCCSLREDSLVARRRRLRKRRIHSQPTRRLAVAGGRPPQKKQHDILVFFFCLVHYVSRILYPDSIGGMIISLDLLLPTVSNELPFRVPTESGNAALSPGRVYHEPMSP